MKALAPDQPNLSGFVETSAGLLALGGLDHMGSASGQILRVSQRPGEGWTAEMLAELPDEPLGWMRARDGSLLAITETGAVAIGANGAPRALLAPIEAICQPCRP